MIVNNLTKTANLKRKQQRLNIASNYQNNPIFDAPNKFVETALRIDSAFSPAKRTLPRETAHLRSSNQAVTHAFEYRNSWPAMSVLAVARTARQYWTNPVAVRRIRTTVCCALDKVTIGELAAVMTDPFAPATATTCTLARYICVYLKDFV